MLDTAFSWPEILAGLVLSIFLLAIGITKLINIFKGDSIQSSLITIMHQELDRLATQNKLLAEELNKLQIKILDLTKQLHSLTLENQKLHEEIAILTNEIGRLQLIIQEENLR